MITYDAKTQKELVLKSSFPLCCSISTARLCLYFPLCCRSLASRSFSVSASYFCLVLSLRCTSLASLWSAWDVWKPKAKSNKQSTPGRKGWNAILTCQWHDNLCQPCTTTTPDSITILYPCCHSATFDTSFSPRWIKYMQFAHAHLTVSCIRLITKMKTALLSMFIVAVKSTLAIHEWCDWPAVTTKPLMV